MISRTIEGRAVKELMVWLSTVMAGYATFIFFEPLYEKGKIAVMESGLADVLPESRLTGSYQQKFLPASILNFRGSFKPMLATGEKSSPAEATPRGVTLNANAYGHFHAMATINGQEIEFMTDTGATYVALTYETALKLGISPSSLKFSGRSTTANGVAKVASVTLDAIQIDKITIRDVQAVIAEPGRMSQNLLGMSFISKLSGFELTRDRLLMTQ